jgi:hypothetical protein
MVCGCAMLAMAPSWAGALAEYAIRWDPSQGGPRSGVATLAALGISGADKDNFEIRYFTVRARPDKPDGLTRIVRERHRTNKERHELTYKLRGLQPFSVSPSLADWTCPIGATDDKKDEVDISVYGRSSTVRAYSRSCTIESKVAPPVVPAALGATPAACTHRVVRWKAEEATVEEWQLKNGRVVIEVSSSGGADEAGFLNFRNRIADRLLEKHRIVPLQSSMTALGSACA